MLFGRGECTDDVLFIHIMIVAVMDAEGNMKGILSQSSTLDYLMRHVRVVHELDRLPCIKTKLAR